MGGYKTRTGASPVRPYGPCIHTLFEEQVARTPDAVALCYGQERWTYQYVNQSANQLAHYLHRRGVGPEMLVGLCLERGPAALISILAIWKAGGAYMLLSPELPPVRLNYLLRDARMPFLLMGEGVNRDIADYVGEVLWYERVQVQLHEEQISNLFVPVQVDNLAYVVYTSGSTGHPKGIESTHGGVVNYLHFLHKTYNLSSDMVVQQLPPLSFDASVRDIFGPLSVGACVVLLPDQETQDPDRVLTSIHRHQVTALLSIVPSLLRVLLTRAEEKKFTCPSVQLVLTSGESLLFSDVAQARSVFGEHVQVVNQYGPTEMTMTSTYYRVEETVCKEGDKPLPIGYPIANTQAYVLDHHFNPVPIGVIGEIYLGGVGIARGYLHQPALTADRFIPHPFAPISGTQLYRTGDRALYRPDGVMEYLGRLDHQIKVRGNRVELGEIEALLAQHASVRQVAVVVREDQASEKRIAACSVPESGQELSRQEWLVAYVVGSQELTPVVLREYLQDKLPLYMIPAYFVLLEALPLTANGKIDRRALPALDRSLQREAVPQVAPSSSLEQMLAQIWQQILGLDHIGIYDNFFDLGGHSLLGTRLIAHLHDTFQVDIPLRTLFEEPTIAHLALVLVQKKAELVDDALLLQDIEDIEHLTDDEVQKLLAADMNQTEKV